MSKLKKIVIIIILFFIAILLNSFSYAVTQEEAGESLANFANNFYDNYRDMVDYGDEKYIEYSSSVAAGVTFTDGRYKFSESNFAVFMIKKCWNINTNNIKYFIENKNNADNLLDNNNFKVNYLDNNILKNTDGLKKGDLCHFSSPKNGMYLYVGNSEYIYMSETKMERGKIENPQVVGIYRISEEKAKSIKKGNITEIFDMDYEDEYGKYYGTTEGRYVGSYNIISWLFSQFVGFMDYLFGIIAYIIRAPFVGWANIIEEMINGNLVAIQGVQVKEVNGTQDVQTPETIEKRTTNGDLDKPIANDKLKQKTVDTSNRINIEDIIYNNVPILDVDIFDVNLDKYVSAGKIKKEEAEKSTTVLLRKNVAIWYYSIRNFTIIIMLLILVYLGIRLSISTIGEKKAQYKELLKAWVVGFAVIFLIHYFMILVIDINNILVDTFHNSLSGQLQGSESLYDTIRTRAYSFKLSEGMPATILYMVLIYFLIRFLFVYIKRYFTINILALMGPIIGAKYAYDKIQKGKTKSLSNWMFDFAMNVLLQSVHGILYSVFIVMAFDISVISIPGFVLALILLNFIFKAEDLFLKIFKFDGRASSIRDVRENKNYFAEAYKVTTGITYFSKAIPKYGWGFVKGTAGYLGATAGLAGQVVTTGVNTVSWIGRNIKHGGGQEFRHGDFVGTVTKIKDNVAAGVTGKLDDALFKVTSMRSLRLGLAREKLKNPEKYKATKQMLAKRKKDRRQLLKRSLGSGVKSVSTMAKLMAGIPMIIVDPGSGFTMLSTTVGDLKNMAKGSPRYGHLSKKKIRRRRGRIVATLLVGTPMIAANETLKDINQFTKDKKEIEKDEEILAKLRLAKIEEDAMEQAIKDAMEQLEALPEDEKEEAIDQFNKALAESIDRAIHAVLWRKDIETAIKSYMRRHKISRLQVSDIEQLLREFNLDNIESEISRLSGIEQDIIDKLKREVEQLKEKLDSISKNVTLTEDEQREIDRIKTEIEDKDKQLKIHSKKIEIFREVGKKASKCQGLENYMIHKDLLEKIIYNYLKDYNKKHKLSEIGDSEIDEIVKIFSEQLKEKAHSYTTRDRIEEQFNAEKTEEKKTEDKKLDRKKATNAILGSFIEKAEKRKSNSSQGNTERKTSESFFDGITEIMKEIQVLDQQNIVMYGNASIQARKFARNIKKHKSGREKRKK